MEYWDMTLEEISLVIKNFKEKEEMRARETMATVYTQSALTAKFILTLYNGKKLPSLQETFPTQFDDVGDNEKNEELLLAWQKEQMLDFALRRNKYLEKGR